VVWATKDPAGTDLQRAQVVKGWVDADGTSHEQVFDVAGNAGNGAGVDPDTCAPTGAGAAELCAVWHDPTFSPDRRAFYYVRLLENPTCRWSTRVCQASGVNPFSPTCAVEAAAAGERFADCCRGTADDPFLEPVIQERAWSSPIWYRPDGIARMRARLTGDTLKIRLTFGAAASLDPIAEDVTVRVADAGDLWHVTLPAGTLRPRRNGTFAFHDADGALDGLRRAAWDPRGTSRELRLTIVRDFAAVPRADHFVTLSVASGLYRATRARWWTLQGDALRGR
jgi:hypothetical protein